MPFVIQAIAFFIGMPGSPIDWASAGPILIGEVVLLGPRKKA